MMKGFILTIYKRVIGIINEGMYHVENTHL